MPTEDRAEGIALEVEGSGHYVAAGDRLSRPLFEGGERCRQRHYTGHNAKGQPLWTDHSCDREPHDEGEHECGACCGFRWLT